MPITQRAGRPPGPHARLRPHPAGRRPAGREPAGRRHPGRGDPRRAAAGAPAAVRSRRSPTPARRCSSPPTSPPAASTSTTSRWSLHYDPPTDAKTYLHRSGRTARAGAGGVVVSLLLPDQVGQAKRRFRQAKVDPDVDPDPSGRRRRSPSWSPAACTSSRWSARRASARPAVPRRAPSAPRRRPAAQRPAAAASAPTATAPAASVRRATAARAVAGARPRATVLRRPGPELRSARRPCAPSCPRH